MRRVIQTAALVLLATLSLRGEEGKTAMQLWPHGVPGEAATQEAEMDGTTPRDNRPGGRTVVRLANVTQPSMTFYPAPKDKNTHAAVLVFPGGGYRILAADLEGSEICEWLNGIGVNAFLVKYRVPQPKTVVRYEQPLQDAQRAMGMVRSRAKEFDIEPERIGTLGFSAGGHLLAVLSNAAEKRTYTAQDEADKVSARPDFVVLVYPAYLSVEDKGEALAPEVQPHGTPPTFIVQTEDDKNFIGGTLLYYRALRDAKIPAEMHVYSHGGHGYGMRHTADAVTDWPVLAARWITGTLPGLRESGNDTAAHHR